MEIITLTRDAVDRGRVAFHLAALQFMCGPNASPYSTVKRRKGGLPVVPGAIVAAIEMGFTTPFEIVPAVARATRCLESTIVSVLEGLGSDEIPDRIWSANPNGSYRLMEPSALTPFTVLFR